MDKNKIILYGAAVAFVAITVCMFFPGKKKEETSTETKPKNEVAEIPEGDTQEITTSKMEAYQRSNRNSVATEYWLNATEEEKSMDDLRKSSDELFKPTQTQPVTYSPPTYTQPYRETPQEREARHKRRQEEAIELAERMAAEQNGNEADLMELMVEKEVEPVQTKVSRPSASITSLDDDFSSSGVSSLDDETDLLIENDSQPFKCMFARESKVKNGQRVSVILLEDIMVSGIPVPKNTHLMASCKLSGRLELEFENIEIGGRILHLGYEAYDVDGSRGIYCPDVSTAGQQARSRGSNIISSTLTGRMGRIASEVLSTGVSIAQSAGGEVTVSVPAGYTFYIVKIKK